LELILWRTEFMSSFKSAARIEKGASSPRPSPPQVCGGEGENKAAQKDAPEEFPNR
jgi:hypothetical protein